MHASTLGNAQSVTSWSRQDRASVAFSVPTARRNVRRGSGKRALPNKPLKLPGGDRSKGNGMFAPWRARTCVPMPCAGGRVARSLSAVR